MAERAAEVLRVILIDDHQIVRRGLRSILELEPDLTVVAEAAGRSEALRALELVSCEVILLDLKLSAEQDAEGLELCTEILRRWPDARIVILSTFIDENLLEDALHRGAKAYVLKDVDAVELVRIIRAVSRGKSGFDARSAAVVRSLVRHRSGGGDPLLTEREREVVALLAQGLTNRRIGSALFISESTAKFHVHNVLRKLGARSRAEVAYVAGRHELPADRHP